MTLVEFKNRDGEKFLINPDRVVCVTPGSWLELTQ